MKKGTETKRRRQNNLYSKLSQFSRLRPLNENKNQSLFSLSMSPSSSSSSSSSPSSSPRRPHAQMWRPSFSFHFAAVSVLKRFYRRIKCFFISPQTQTLPYYNPTPSSSTTNKLLTFLSREDTNMFNQHQQEQSSSHFAQNWMSYYWHRLLSRKHQKELD